ncbi:MAG: HEAT repeat domain-containing protein [Nostoc sp.]|uniref:HEAT repeat domain-containing protein n=1 Tax=Nostoc sp. TaxID=1180 RepID=UPI002FF494ED
MQPLQPVSGSDLQPFLSAPEELLQQSVALQLAVASFHQTPRSFLEILVNSPDAQVAEAASLHVNLAGEITDGWQQAVDEILQQRQLGQNDRLAVELLKIGTVPPFFLSEWVPAERLIQGLRNPQMPLRYRLQLLQRLSQEPTLEPRLQVAESPETPSAVLEQLAGDLELPVRLAVKFNPSCPPPLIELVEGQYAVASDWNTDSEQLAMLGQSRWAWVRLAVAQNPSATAETLMQLAGDAVYKIQLAVANNPETPADVLAVLAENQDKAIQATVAEHRNATEEILHQLFPTQQQLLKRRENLPTSILERFFNEEAADKPVWKNSEHLYLFIEQPNTPTRILAELANVDLEALRAEILTKSNSSPIIKTLETWVQDETRFLANIAKHPQASVEILQHLTQYPNPYIQLAVAQNSQTPEALRDMLLQQLAVGSKENIRTELASNPQTPVAILDKLAGASSSLNTMMEMLHQIAPDATPSLLNRIKIFIDNHQSPELIIFWLQQGEEFRNSILKEWDDLIDALNESEQQTLAYLASQKSSIKWEGKFTAERRDRPGKKSVPSDAKAAENYHLLDGLLHLLNSSYNSDRSNLEVIAALLGNPSTPATLREQLWQQCKKSPDEFGRYLGDTELRMALAFNPSVPEAERNEYLQQLIATSNDLRDKLAKNPATPEYLLRRIADERKEYLWRRLAENPNTPTDLLMRFLHEEVEKTVYSNETMFDIVIANPNLPILERYRLLLGKEEAQEIANAHQLMARRTDSPYALAQVLVKGDQKARIIVAHSNKTPIPVLEQLAKDADETVRKAVMGNSNLPLSTLIELTQDTSDKIRLNLAYILRNRSTNRSRKEEVPVVLLERLARDENKDVRVAVAENLQSSLTLLEQLARDASADVRISVAKNPNTPSFVLEQLAQDTNADVRISVAKNPNTLPAVLETFDISPPPDAPRHALEGLNQVIANRYRELFYVAFADNPNTPPSLLARIARQIPREIDKYVNKVAKHRNTPASALEQLAKAGDATTRCNVAENPNTPVTVLEELITDEYSPVLWAIARRADTPTQLLERLLLRFTDPNNQDYQQICYAISNRRELPLNLLELLMQSNLQQVYQRIATQANLPQAIVERLMAVSNESVLSTLARNQSLATEFLTQLAQNPNPNVCSAIVNHPNITPELWIQLANHIEVSVRQVIAANSNTPMNILEMLTRDSNKDVRVKVAANSNSPVSVLEQLAGDEDAFVRIATASNSHLPETILTQLTNDEKVEVRRAVAQNPNTPALIRETLRDFIVQPTTRQTSPTLRGLKRLYNPSTDDLVGILAEYASSENAFVRFVTLLHPLTPREVLTQAAQSASWLERYAVADNSGTPSVLRQQLAQDSNRIVRAAARV